MISNVSTQDEVGPVAGEGGEPVAWLHTMSMELGQTQSRITAYRDNPFGVAGRDYDATYTVTAVPLYATPPADALRVAVDALEPFSAVLADIGSSEHDADSFRNPSRDYAKSQGISVGHIRRAAEALAALKAGGVK